MKKYPFTSLSDEEYEAIINGEDNDDSPPDARDESPFDPMENP